MKETVSVAQAAVAEEAVLPVRVQEALGRGCEGGPEQAWVSRIARRLLSLTAAIPHNWLIGNPGRSLTAYDD